MITKQLLDRLADLRTGRTVIDLEKQALIDSIITPEILAQIAEIDEEYAEKYERIDAEAAELEAAIKQDVIATGETIKGAYLQAVWSKPRVSWDTKALDGYAAAHPEIAQFRKEGEPSVSIRAVK